MSVPADADTFREPGASADLGIPGNTSGILDGEVEQDDENPFLGEDQASRTAIGDDDDGDLQEEEQNPTDVVEPVEAAPPPPEAPELYAGRYQSMDAFEQGYKDIQAGFTKMAMENKDLVSSNERMEQELEQLKGLILQRAMEEDPEFAEQIQAQQQMNELVDQRVEQQIGPMRDQAEAQQRMAAAQRFAAEAESAVRTFWAEHNITAGDNQDVAMRRVLDTLVASGARVSPANPDHLQLIYEASQNPRLLMEVVNSRPELIQVPGGMDYLRERAGATIPSNGAAPAGTPAPAPQQQQRAVRRRVETHVETGSGTPGGTPTEPSGDEFDDAVDWFRQRHQGRGPLFSG